MKQYATKDTSRRKINSFRTVDTRLIWNFPQLSKKYSIPLKYSIFFSRARQLIKDALLNNTFLQNSLDGFQLRLIVDAMYDKTFEKNDFLCEQGAYGTHLFVTASGSFQVIANGRPVKTIGPGKVIGELAILYNCTRTASVQGKPFILMLLP